MESKKNQLSDGGSLFGRPESLFVPVIISHGRRFALLLSFFPFLFFDYTLALTNAMTDLDLTPGQEILLRVKDQARSRLDRDKKGYVTIASHTQSAQPASLFFTLLQLNCNKNAHVLKFCVENCRNHEWGSIDVLCISEPPYDSTNRAIHELDNHYRSFYWTPGEDEDGQPYAVISLLNQSISFDPTSIHISRNMVSIQLKWDHVTLVVHSVYVPARKGRSRRTMLESVSSIMKRGNQPPTIIMGDFNLHHRRWEDEHFTTADPSEETDLIIKPWDEQAWKLLNIAGQATRFDPRGITGLSVIDLAFASPELANCIGEWTRLDLVEGTDHFPCKMTIETNVEKKTKTFRIPGFNWRMAKAMERHLKGLKEPSFSFFYKVFEEQSHVINEEFKEKNRKPFSWKIKDKDKPEVKRLKSEIRVLKRQLRKDTSNHLMRGKIRKARQQVSRIMARNKKISLEKHIRNLDHNEVWKHLPIKKARKKLAILKDQDRIITEPKQMLEAIMDYSHPAMVKRAPQPKVDVSNNPEPPISTNEVKMAVHLLKQNAAAGQDGISTKLVKKLYVLTPSFMEKAYANVYQQETFPSQWLQTRLAIIPKNKSSSAELSNVRIIGIPSTLAKVMHNIIRARLLFWTIKNDVLEPSQHGILPGTSTTHMLSKLNHLISPALSYGGERIAILSKLDIEKAFDKVDHTEMIKALVKANFPGKLINNVNAALTDLLDIGNLEGNESVRTKISGTIQGCPFSPLLFSILLAEPLKQLRAFADKVEAKFKEIEIDFLVYLDDLVLVVKTSDKVVKKWNKWKHYGAMLQGITAAVIETYQKSLWDIGLSLAHNKSEHITMPNTAIPLTVQVNGLPMNQVKNITILGVTYSAQYHSFNTVHALEQANKGKGLIQDLYLLGRFIRADKRKLMINATIIKKIMYAAAAWGERISMEAVKKLNTTFRTLMLKAKSSGSYTPTLTATLASGILPANIMLQKINFQNSITKHGTYIDGQHLQFIKEINPLPFFHPAEIPIPATAGFFESQHEVPTQDDSILHLFTDASVGHRGAGFAILEFKSQRFLTYKANKNMDAFNLELTAVKEAIMQMEIFRSKDHKKCIIYTDSQAVHQTLTNPLSTHETVIHIRRALKEKNLLDFVQLAWVRSHGDILGNQLVDSLASIAHQIGTPITLNLPRSKLKDLVAQEVDRLMEEFFEERSAKHFKFFFPKWNLVKEYLKNPSMAYLRFLNSQEPYLREFSFRLTKMGCESEHRKLYNFQTIACECDASSTQDSKHLVFTCKILTKEREQICASLKINDQMKRKFEYEGLRNKEFYEMVQRIHKVAEAKLTAYRQEVQKLAGQMEEATPDGME